MSNNHDASTCTRRTVKTFGQSSLQLTRSAFRHKFGRLLLTGFVFGGLVVQVAGVASASVLTGKSKSCRSANGIKVTNSAVCKGLAFYKGKTIMFNSGTPAGTFDLTARALTPALERYLGATIDVVDIAGTGSIKTQDTTNGSIANGLTIGQLNAVGDAELSITGQPGLNFNPVHVPFVGGTGSSPDVLISTTGPGGFANFAALKASTSKVRELVQVGGTNTALLNILNGVLGMHEQMLYGYGNVAAILSGFDRGDGPVTVTTLPFAGALIQAHQAVALAVTSKVPLGMDYRSLVDNAPTFSQILNKYPAKTKALKKQYASLISMANETGFPMIVPDHFPANDLATMRAALQWAFTQSSTKEALLNAGVGDTYLSAIQAKNTYIESVKLGAGLAPYLAGS